MGKTKKVPFSESDLKAGRVRSWADTAETVAVIAAGAGVALALIYKQAIFAIVPPVFALGFNIINRTHRVQQARTQAMATVKQADRLRGDLNSLTTALNALPIGDRVLEIEDYLYRVNAALVQMQQRQEALAAAADEDREKIKEAFTIVRQGVYNLNDYTNATIEEIRGDIAQLRQMVAELPASLRATANPALTGQEFGMRGYPGGAPPVTIDLAPVQYHIERLDERVDHLEQQYQGTIQPQIQRLAYGLRQMRSNALPAPPPPSPVNALPPASQTWIEQIDRRLEQVLPYKYQVVQTDRTDLLFKALQESTNHLILVTPWLRAKPQLSRFLAVLGEVLEQGVMVSIGWGDRADIAKKPSSQRPILLKNGGWRYLPDYDPHGFYAALPELLRLRKRYKRLQLKLLGTREKLIVCDQNWALMGGQHFLCDMESGKADTGLFTTDQKIVADISQRFNTVSHHPALRAADA